MSKAIEVKNLKYRYSDDSLTIDDISFSIEKGSYTTIIGHNGSGKSTIAKLLLGLLEKQSGSILIDGIELNYENLDQIRNKIGIVFQNPDNQFIGSTVRDDIAFGLENHCVEREKMDPIIESFAKKVNMTDFLESEPTKLSGGQKQRVAIASVLAMDLKIIVFDEATSMLDPTGKREINRLIKELHEENEITIISITHDIEEVAQSDNVLVIDNGRLAMSGSPEKVFSKEKVMVKMKLDIPFVYKLGNSLRAKGVKVSNTLDLERMADEVCQYILKK
ncbi:MAG: energy-coupling factor transporter ATPase [Bacillota bacterium]|nr:energy-coupling factor transporter ATPase [Bacillota bacterium]NLL26030.1 energy-coupling factor transporter ATPase [Erysipelotrichia bacterium]